MNRCRSCGKMARWEDLELYTTLEQTTIYHIEQVDWFEHRAGTGCMTSSHPPRVPIACAKKGTT